MKHINKIATAFLITSIFLASCQKDTFTKANINHNAPATVVPNVILPSIQISLAYAQGGDLTRFSTLFMQQSVGYSRQAQAYYTYVVTSTDMDTQWGNLYTSVLGNNSDLMTRADAEQYNEYSGIARIMAAYSLQLLVDGWGSVPYSQALLGNANTHPVYDNDKALYDTIASLVNVGIAQLSGAPGAVTPSTDDLIYGGNASKWIKFGHAIKARLYIHQSKNSPAFATQALAEAALAFTSNADNAEFYFANAETAANPIYQFNEQRGDIDYASGTLVDMLTALNDPRLTIYTTPDYSDVNGAGIGDYYGSIAAPVEFITYDEMLFLKAEATLRATGNYAAAQGFYQAAIAQNMTKLGVSPGAIATYIAANGTLPTTSVNAAIAAVAKQEYLALYLNPEVWTMWRRTGSPALVPTAGSNGIPRRYLYPQNEYSLNGANVPTATLFSPKIFWDN